MCWTKNESPSNVHLPLGRENTREKKIKWLKCWKSKERDCPVLKCLTINGWFICVYISPFTMRCQRVFFDEIFFVFFFSFLLFHSYAFPFFRIRWSSRFKNYAFLLSFAYIYIHTFVVAVSLPFHVLLSFVGFFVFVASAWCRFFYCETHTHIFTLPLHQAAAIQLRSNNVWNGKYASRQAKNVAMLTTIRNSNRVFQSKHSNDTRSIRSFVRSFCVFF